MGDVSLADVMALVRSGDRDGDGFGWGCGGGMMMFYFLFFILLWGGNGWGNNGNNAALQGSLTRSDLFEGFNNQEIVSKLDGITNGICSSSYAALQSANSLGQQLAQNNFNQQTCCCEIKNEVMQNRFGAERNTCDIITALHAEGEATRALINANEMQNLRDRLEARDREVMIRDFQLSQMSQTANIIETVRPFPQPAYITCSPYTSNLPLNAYGYNGYYGNGNGCCYGN